MSKLLIGSGPAIKTTRTIGPIVMALALVAVACGGSSNIQSAEGSESKTVRGLIQEVEAKNLLELESLVIRTDSGEVFVLEARSGDSRYFPPTDLRQHMVLGAVVTIMFHRQDGVLIIDRIED